MPITIKELHIKINVQDDGQSSTSQSQSQGKKKGNIVEECVEQVMFIQNRKDER